MSLGPPLVVGPISEWLDSVVVEGCLPGATVHVQTDEAAPTVIAKSIASGGRDHIPVSVPLKAGQRLVAQQSNPGDVSPLTPSKLAVTVSASPRSHAQLSPLAFRSRLLACGSAVWLTGAAPGAEVTLSDGANAIGQGRADNAGNARLHLSTPLPTAGKVVSGSQSAPAPHAPLAGAPAVAMATTSPLPPGALPMPRVGRQFPMGCEASVRVDGVLDGAEVTVERASDGLRQKATFDLDSLWFPLQQAFRKEGDRISVSQAMPRCEHRPSDPDIEPVRPAVAPDPMLVDSPCAGSPLIHVSRLRPGADLRVDVHTQPARSYAYRVPPGSTIWDIPVEPLPPNSTVTVTLDVCGFTTSSTVPVAGDAGHPAPEPVEPLYRCARAVAVKTGAGAHLEVWGDSGSGPMQLSPRVYAAANVVAVAISPFLVAPEDVWVEQISCGGIIQRGRSVATKDHPALKTIELQEPLVEGAIAVLPTNAIPGGHLTVFAADRGGGPIARIGQGDVTAARPSVRLTRPLSTHDQVWALEEMCTGEQNEGIHRYSVIPGVMRFVLNAPLEQLSQSLNGNVVLHSGVFECRFVGGGWSLTVDAENTDPGYDCGLTVDASLDLLVPLAFGESIDIDLAAAGGLPQGLASKNYPSHWTAYRAGTSPKLQNAAFWAQVLGTTATWELLAVAWRNYPAIPDQPDWPGGKKPPVPDPNALPNEPVDDDNFPTA